MGRRGLVLAVVSLIGCSALGADEKIKPEQLAELEGPELFAAVREVNAFDMLKKSPADTVAIALKLNRALAGLDGDSQGRSVSASEYLQAACRVCDANQLSQLVDAWDALGFWRGDKSRTFVSLADASLRCQVAALAKEHPSVQIESISRSIPPELADFPPDILAAWQSFQNALEPFQHLMKQSQTGLPISFPDNQKSFYALLGGVLRGDGEDALPKISAYSWSGFSGSGNDGVEIPRSYAILLALVQEHRLTEAVGAALSVHEDLFPAGDGSSDQIIAFLQAVGIDWESVMAGAAAAREQHDAEFYMDRRPLRVLAAFGSERAAHYLTEIARVARPSHREQYASALRQFLPESKQKKKDGGEEIPIDVGPEYTPRHVTEPISADAQKAIVKTLVDFASADVPTPLGRSLVDAFRRVQTPDVVPALQILLQHPSDQVSKEAANVLRAMGQDVKTVARKQSYRLRLLVNGQPLPAGTALQAGVSYREKGGAGSSSSPVNTDERGIVSINREDLFNYSNRDLQVSLFLTMDDPKTAGDAWFRVAVPVPPNPDEITNVPVELTSLEVALQDKESRQPISQGSGEVMVRRASDDYLGPSGSATLKLSGPVAQPLHLDGLQPGDYQVSVNLAGFQHAEQRVEVRSGGSKINMVLDRGSDVHAKITLPGREGNRRPFWKLLANGKEIRANNFDYETNTFRGLPPGAYTLHACSRDETKQDFGDICATGPDEMNYAGQDIAFTIADDSPAAIDLGEIRLEEIPK